MTKFFRSATAAAALLIAAGAAQAATTGSVNLSGSVGQSCNITVSAQSIASSLDLTTTSAGTTVANVTETCNDKLGYNVSLATTNGTTTGLFKGPSGNTDTLAYTVTYNGVAKTFSSGSTNATTATARTAAGGVTKALAIAFTGSSSLNADTYTDTLTLTMTAN